MTPEPRSNPVPSETRRALAGAMRFFRFDRTAVAEFDPGRPAALRSFLAALYGVPFYAALLALEVWQSPTRPDDLWIYALVQALAYVIHMAAFPLAVLIMARALGHREQWPLFVTAQNWLGLPQIVLLLVCAILSQSGILGTAGAALLVAFQLYSLAIEAFVTQVTLGINALGGLAVVLLDIVLGVGIDRIAGTMF